MSGATNFNKGFSLIEVLVALVLMSLMFGIIPGTTTNDRDKIEDFLSYLERSIRYSQDEAVLKNRIHRIRLNLEEVPQQLSVQVGYDANIILKKFNEEVVRFESDQEEVDKQKKEVNKNFNTIPEFQDKPYEISESIKIIGIGFSDRQLLVSDEEAHVYVHASGEKDNAFIIIGSNDEIITFEIESFTMDFRRNYYKIDLDEYEDLEKAHNEIALRLFKEWKSS